ncbi:GC-rich sequence DNA-binding factor 2 [Sarcoptes scabiei]|nr:GC-rich sequence DNA-binding factor 2 [Sarcoptes scabiei]
MFSASWPEEVQSLVTKYLKQDHAFVSVGGTELVANHNIDQQVIVCTPFERFSQLDEIFHAHSNDKILLFCNTKSTCDSISRMIRKKYRLNSSPLHGESSALARKLIKILEESSCKIPEELRTIEHNDHKSQPKRKRSFQQQHYWRQNRFNLHHHHHHHDFNNQYKNRQ